MCRALILGTCLFLFILAVACEEISQADADADIDADIDADSDVDSDVDSDGDADEDECYPTIDVVFVLDVSSSMSVLLRTLQSQIGVVWRAASEYDADPHFGLVVFVDDVTVTNGGEPYDTREALAEELGRWAEHAALNQQTQSDRQNTDWPENSLDALVVAATEFSWRGQDETLRVVIHATDDTFMDGGETFSSSIMVENTYERTVEILRENHIRVMSFAAHGGGPYGDTNVEPGFFTEYMADTGPQPPIPEATQGEVFDIHLVGPENPLSEAITEFLTNELCEEYVVY